MKKYLMLLSTLLVSACGGGGGDGPAAQISVTPGIYSGTITPSGGTSDAAVAIITSDGRAAIVDIDSIETFIGTISGASMTGTIYSSSTVSATAQVSSASGSNISGTYSSSLGGGTFAMIADPTLYNRTSSLSKLAGTWVDSVFTNVAGTTTWTVQSDGSLAVDSDSGCTGTGNFSVFNPSNNEYDLTLTITNCAGYDGNYSGIAVLSDTTLTDDTISLVFGNGVSGGISEPIKQ